jgi:hypothetical protein
MTPITYRTIGRAIRMRNSAAAHLALARVVDRRALLHRELGVLAPREAMLHRYLSGLAAESAEEQVRPERALLLQFFAKEHLRRIDVVTREIEGHRKLATTNRVRGLWHRKCASQLWKWSLRL